MKKVICLIMCVVMMLSTSITAFAAYESWGYGESPYMGVGESEIITTVYSYCTVSIPEVLEIYGDTSFCIEISGASFLKGDYLQVNVLNLSDKGYIDLTSDDRTAHIQLRRADYSFIEVDDPYLARIYDTDIEYQMANTEFYASLGALSSEAGHYSGTMQYEVVILHQEEQE